MVRKRRHTTAIAAMTSVLLSTTLGGCASQGGVGSELGTARAAVASAVLAVELWEQGRLPRSVVATSLGDARQEVGDVLAALATAPSTGGGRAVDLVSRCAAALARTASALDREGSDPIDVHDLTMLAAEVDRLSDQLSGAP